MAKKSSKMRADGAPKRMGRPPRARETSGDAVRIRLTAEERLRLEAAAARAGESLAEFVRSAALARVESS